MARCNLTYSVGSWVQDDLTHPAESFNTQATTPNQVVLVFARGIWFDWMWGPGTKKLQRAQNLWRNLVHLLPQTKKKRYLWTPREFGIRNFKLIPKQQKHSHIKNETRSTEQAVDRFGIHSTIASNEDPQWWTNIMGWHKISQWVFTGWWPKMVRYIPQFAATRFTSQIPWKEYHGVGTYLPSRQRSFLFLPSDL